MNFGKLSLRGKLIVVITTVSALVLILAGTVFGVYALISFRHTIVKTTETTAEILGTQCIAPILFNDEHAATETLSALSSEKNIISGAIFRSDGSNFASYAKNDSNNIRIGLPPPLQTGFHLGKSELELTHAIISNGEPIGYIYLCVDLKWHNILMLQYAGMATGVFFLMVLVAVGLSFWGQRIFTQPIKKITNVTEAIACGNQDYTARVPGEDLNDELGVLVRSFNAMLAHIEKSDVKLQSARDKLEERVHERTNELVVEIKHRRQTESDLRQERDMAQKYLDMAGVMLIAFDINGVVTLCNRKVTEITGYSESEIIGKDWFENFIPPAEMVDRKSIFIDALSGRSSWVKYDENPILTKNGEERQIAWHNTLLKNAEGATIGSLSSGIDISDQQEAEEEFHRVQKLESIGTFAGGIAHDFNNFLMVIHGNIELAQLSLDNPLKADSLLNDAIEASGRARGLTRQLITFSKGGEPQKHVVKIDKLVQDTVSFVLTGSNVTANVDIPKDLWLTEVDSGQIEQVLANLIVNANQAMPDGGMVHVSLKNINTESAQKRRLENRCFVEITVSDKGCGIPAGVIPLVFDPYFTTKQEGSGLGLATSYSIIKKHKGHITVESEIDVGSTFHVLLPAISQKLANKKPTATTAKLTQSYNVLLLEDDLMVGPVIEIMLETINCRCTWTKDGVETIEKYSAARESKEPFDIVILDIIVPNGMGGKEASQKLLELDPNITMIISSAYSNDPLMAEYAENGFKECIAKPYNHSELERVLKSILEPE